MGLLQTKKQEEAEHCEYEAQPGVSFFCLREIQFQQFGV